VVESATAIATRTLPAEPVSTSANFTLGIEASGYGIMGQVVETLPPGFVYVNSTLDPGSVVIADNTVKFTLFGETSFNYTVTASNIEGTYYFSGILMDENLKEYEVGGDKEIVIESATATRTLPAESISPGANFTLGIEASGYGAFGQVVETLPAGFVYVKSTLDPGSIEVDAVNNTVKFTLLGETSFNYTLTASDTEGTYTFSGILIDVNEGEHEVGGDAKLVVEEEEAIIATRTLPAEPVSTGANFTIGIEASGYGTFGQVIETLPIGFKYVTSTLDPGSVEVEDSTVKFTLFGETSFNYTVTASDTEGTYYFSGILKDEDMKEYEIGGDKEIVIGEALALFDTGLGTYPSIFGMHTGKITLNQPITVHKLYTYPCPGTGGHTEYVRIYGNGIDESASWTGYSGDWHNIAFPTSFTLEAGKTYNYTIRTGSYPQIIHAKEFNATGGKIICSEFIDANGKRYEDWIPAIRLE